MGGVFLKTGRKLEPGTICKLNILLGHFKHELPILAEAVVIRSIEQGIALKFNDVKLETLPTMQNFIIEHADDPEQVQLEYSSGGGYIFNPQ